MNFIATFLLLATRLLYLSIALIGIGFLIGFHELGHFLFCKLFGIRTPEFSIGFGPELFSKKTGETKFVIKAIPLGGFVEIAGAAEVGQGEQKYAHSKESDSFATKPYYQKFLVMMGGISFNLLFAYLACILIAFLGIPKTRYFYPGNATTIIAQMEPGSTAERYGLHVGDSMRFINNIPVHKRPIDAIQTIRSIPNKTVPVQFKRDGELHEVMVTIGSKTLGNATVGSLGIEFDMKEIPGQPFFGAIQRGIQMANAWTVATVQGFLGIFTRGSVKEMGGPVALISMLSQGVTSSLKIFLILLVIISINLAILNLIPLPILDGGQLLFYTIEAIIRRPLPIKVREYIFIASWLLILTLILFLTIQDVGRIASPHIEAIKQFLGFGR